MTSAEKAKVHSRQSRNRNRKRYAFLYSQTSDDATSHITMLPRIRQD